MNDLHPWAQLLYDVIKHEKISKYWLTWACISLLCSCLFLLLLFPVLIKWGPKYCLAWNNSNPAKPHIQFFRLNKCHLKSHHSHWNLKFQVDYIRNTSLYSCLQVWGDNIKAYFVPKKKNYILRHTNSIPNIKALWKQALTQEIKNSYNTALKLWLTRSQQKIQPK